MNILCFNSAWEHCRISPASKLVGLKLAVMTDAGGSTGQVFMDELLHWAGLTEVQFMQALRELHDLSILCFGVKRIGDENAIMYAFNVDPGSGNWCGHSHDVLFADELEAERYARASNTRIMDPRRVRILAKTNGACFYCGAVEENMHLDHMHPESRGGSSEDQNMIGACMACNVQKKDRTVEEYRAYLSHRRKSESSVVFFGERGVKQEQWA